MLKPTSRRILISAGPPDRIREVVRGVRRQRPGGWRVRHLLLPDPRGEAGGRHHHAGVVHVAVPEAAQLGTADLERPGMPRPYERHVVAAGYGVGLHPKLDRPEGVG